MPEPTDPKIQLHTMSEVQGILRVSKPTVHRLVTGGELSSVRVGHRRFVTEAALVDFIEGQSATAAA